MKKETVFKIVKIILTYAFIYIFSFIYLYYNDPIAGREYTWLYALLFPVATAIIRFIIYIYKKRKNRKK